MKAHQGQHQARTTARPNGTAIQTRLTNTVRPHDGTTANVRPPESPFLQLAQIYNADEIPRLPKDRPSFLYTAMNLYPTGHSFLLHSHKDIAEILLITEGSGIYTVEDMMHPVKKGDIVVIDCTRPHDEFPDPSSLYCSLCVGITNLQLPDRPANTLLRANDYPFFTSPSTFAAIKELMLTMHQLCLDIRRPRQRAASQHIGQAILELTLQMIDLEPVARRQEADQLVIRTLRYIDEHYMEEISLESLAHLFHISTSRLSARFKDYTGYTVYQYIVRRRVGEAQNRLAHTADPVQTIAYNVGFTDPNHFSSAFSRLIGLSPTQYRKLGVDVFNKLQPAKPLAPPHGTL